MSITIKHYGTPRRSGRYPWGSGDSPEQRHRSFMGYVNRLKSEGMNDREIAEGMGISTTELRQRRTIARTAIRRADADLALRLTEKGMSPSAIAKRMGRNESSIRSLLDPALQQRADVVANTADKLREMADKDKYIDVGAGSEIHLNISRTKLDAALRQLEDDGYHVWYPRVTQQGTGKQTSLRVLTPPEVDYTETAKNKANIKLPYEFRTEDGGETWTGLEPINNISSDRVHIRYKEDGGVDKDGLIELRRGVADISLGNARYAQVRVGVDGTHYLKGMAVYSDDIPAGVDIVYNTNKAKGTPKEKVFKPQEADVADPFGSGALTQKHYIDADGKRKLSALNVVSEEGDWADWHKTLSSQMLSKQLDSVAKKQLQEAYDIRQDEYNEIMSLTNPAVKKRLLEPFADSCDSAAVHLKAAALPRQGSHVILPFPGMKENEIYAPNFRDAESVVLIRHPHGGIFEIPQLIVNNKYPEAVKTLGNARDAVGIHPKVAAALSGADFDGDTVLVIPNDSGTIHRSQPIQSLLDFDPKASFKNPPGAPKMKNKQLEMGKISNLITDMTIKGASQDEIVRAVKHSMVVIDAEKHDLDYKRSFVEHGIAALKQKYQGRENAGAATLISKAKSIKRVPERQYGRTQIGIDQKTGKPIYRYGPDPETGEKVYTETGKTHKVSIYNKKGPYRINEKTGKKIYLEKIGEKDEPNMQEIYKMSDEKDAHALSSGTRMERVYAEHANRLKALANQARKEAFHTTPTPYSPIAKATYSKEVAALKAKLNEALKHAPQERQAQLLANAQIKAIRDDNPDLDDDDLRKKKAKALIQARKRYGGRRPEVEITDREWEAIQAGALSNSTLNKILLTADLDKVKVRALPRTAKSGMSAGKVTRARNMAAAGYTRADIADALGVSINSLDGVID